MASCRMSNFDCVIVGGGMVGAACALSLSQLGLKVAVVEKYPAKPFSAEQEFDLRVSAISLGSEHLLTQLDAWSNILKWRSCPYRRLAVWETEQVETEFSAQEISQTHLGHIVENRLIQLSLWQKLATQVNVTLLCPEEVNEISQTKTSVTVKLNQSSISTKLLIAADGANSSVRQMSGIGISGWDYKQSAMLINVATAKPQQDITWQQYYPTGPVAMLPMPGNNASLVWYHDRDEIKKLSLLSNNKLREAINNHFPARLGEIEVKAKGAFPLTRRHANSYQNNRIILIGDAAHTINPMAGQGVNLGFKDVKALQTVIADAIGNGESWSEPLILARYERLRRNDNLLMMSTMDMLYKGFSHPSPFIKLARNLGLKAANNFPIVKSKALAYACGLS